MPTPKPCTRLSSTFSTNLDNSTTFVSKNQKRRLIQNNRLISHTLRQLEMLPVKMQQVYLIYY